MSEFNFIETMPEQVNFNLFESVLNSVYDKNSPRFILGNEPDRKHLKLCIVLLKNEAPIGRFAFYINPLLEYLGQKAASIGSYECIEDDEASSRLINYARELAEKNDFPILIGPMEGSTWNNYRFSKNNSQANFFMEPYHHTYYNQQFTRSEFFEIGHYVSNMISDLSVDPQKINDYEHNFKKMGAHFRTIDFNDFENELMKIAEFSIASFSENFLYTPIHPSDFVNKYISLKKYFDARMIWIVENKKGEIEAIIFAIKDYNDPSNETIIIKSIARKKESDFKGIGQYLALKVMQIAKDLKYTKVIHAFMLIENHSLGISTKINSTHFKSYKLYAVNTSQNG